MLHEADAHTASLSSSPTENGKELKRKEAKERNGDGQKGNKEPMSS